MKIAFVLLSFFQATMSYAFSDLPFEESFGRYEVASCRKIESSGNASDFSRAKLVEIEKSPSCMGAPSTQILFAEFESQLKLIKNCTTFANQTQALREIFSPGTGLNSEFYKYAKDEDGSDHYFIRMTANEKTYIYTDSWLKKSGEEGLVLRLKRREVPISEPTKNLMSFEYELMLKRAK